jgi:hypothetical protein
VIAVSFPLALGEIPKQRRHPQDKTPSHLQTVKAMEKESEILLGGVKLTCKHCGHDRFNSRNALLNTKVLTFFETDWLANTAEVFVCARCGFLHWVLPPDPTTIEKRTPA